MRSLYLTVFFLCIPLCCQMAIAEPPVVINVSTMRQASLLKLHFMRRGEIPLSRLQSDWKSLEELSESPSTPKLNWFWIQNVRAFSAYRLPFVKPSEGAAAYGEIFTQADNAPRVKAENIVRISINEYIFTLTSKISSLKLQSSPEIDAVTIKAWHAYLKSKQYTDPLALKSSRVHWLKIFDDVPAPNALNKVVIDELKEVKKPSYDLLVVAAYLSSNTNPNRAVDLQLKAKPLLPHLSNGKVDLEEASDYYTRLIRYLNRSGRLEDVIKITHEEIEKTGKGYVDLLEALCSKPDSGNEQQQVLDTLSSASEEEIITVSGFLFERAINHAADPNLGESIITDQTVANQLTVLLQRYLTANRTRNPTNELLARLRLADVLFAQDHLDDARKVVDGSKDIAATTNMDSDLRTALERLSERITHAQNVTTP